MRRPRPPYNVGDGLVISVDRYSFPSGHTSRYTLLARLALACGAAAAAPRAPAAAAAFCAWAAVTSVSRVVMGRHYAGDVLAGAALGAAEFALLRRFAPPVCVA